MLKFIKLSVLCNVFAISLFSQNKLFVEAQFTPKLSVNNSTGINAAHGYYGQNNEPDGRASLGAGIDYSFMLGFKINRYNTISVGVGKFTVNQKFVPSFTFFGDEYKNIYRKYTYLMIPITYERLIVTKKNWKVFLGGHLSFIGDVFKHKIDRFFPEEMPLKDGTKNPKYISNYVNNYVNMNTFNVLYGVSGKMERKINKSISAYTSIQIMQGIRPLITSVMFFNKNNLVSMHSISTTNGQSLMMNLGVRYNF